MCEIQNMWWEGYLEATVTIDLHLGQLLTYIHIEASPFLSVFINGLTLMLGT